MKLTPAQKGGLTKARKVKDPRNRYTLLRELFQEAIPREQAKHAARRYMRGEL